MTSQDLMKDGFEKWWPFNTIGKTDLMKALPLDPGVYVIRRKQAFSRARGESDVFYIGSAANVRGLRGRLTQYFSPGPTQSTNKRILALISQSDDYEIAFRTTPTPADAKVDEIRLRQKYESHHGELPPGNLLR